MATVNVTALDARIRSLHQEVCTLQRQSLRSARDCGELLSQASASTPYKEFVTFARGLKISEAAVQSVAAFLVASCRRALAGPAKPAILDPGSRGFVFPGPLKMAVERERQWPDTLPEWAEESRPIIFAAMLKKFRNAQKANDGVQYAFSRACERQNPGYFQSYGHFVSWLKVVARNHILDLIKEEGRRQPLPDEPGDDLLEKTPRGWKQRQGVKKRTSETSEHVRGCLEQLSPEDRTILACWHFDKLTDQAIGNRLYGDVGTLSGRGQRARRKRLQAEGRLRECMLRNGFDPDTWEIAA